MVLKKSNTRFNSGATQRAANHARLLQVGDLHTMFSRHVQNKIKVTVNQLKKDYESREKSRSYFKLIEDYIEYHLFDSNVLDSRQFDTTSCTYALKKKQRWHLPEIITTMIKDSEFLQNHIPRAKLFFKKIQERPGVGRNELKECFSIMSTDFLRSDDKQNHQTPKSRRRITYHGRGVQRRHLFHTKVEQGNRCIPEKERSDPVCTFSFDFGGPFHLDVRSTTNKLLEKKWSSYMRFAPHKASMKLKGCVNGRYCHRKGYTKIGMKQDTHDVLNDSYYNYVDSDSDEIESELNADDAGHRNDPITCYMTDLLKMPRFSRGRKKKTGGGYQTSLLPSDSTDPELKYPKGSYIIMSDDRETDLYQSISDWEVINQKEVLITESPFIHQPSKKEDGSSIDNSSLLTKVNTDDFHWMEDSLFSYMDEDCNLVENKMLFNNEESFQQVNILMKEEEVTWFSFQNKTFQEKRHIGGYDVVIGRSLPFCFVIDVSRVESHQKLGHKRYLTARQRGMCDVMWLISVQDPKLPQDHCKVLLQHALDGHYPQGISLLQLADLVASIHEWLDVGDSMMINLPNDVAEDTIYSCDNKENPEFCCVNSLVCHFPTILSPEAAYDLLKSVQDETQHKKSTNSSLPGQVMDISNQAEIDKTICELTECDICCVTLSTTDIATSAMTLLPCMHTFCLQCWGTFISNNMKAVANSIVCMHSNCSCVIDEVTVMTLVPSSVITKWHEQMRNRSIDLSPFCRWCPNIRCQRVAVSIKEVIKQKFGKPVRCDCMHIWCGSCQKAPHWPAACDQMDMLRDFIYKVQKDMNTLSTHTNFFVQVKKCPSCLYPIQKNGGCPSMVCSMCNMSYCWTCNRPLIEHDVLKPCYASDRDTVAYNLQNRLEVSLMPLKYYAHIAESHVITKKLKKVKPWFVSVNSVNAGFNIVASHSMHWKYCNSNAKLAAGLAAEGCHFLQQVAEALECFFLLLCFASAKKGKSKSQKCLEKYATNELYKLQFIMQRLEERVLKKPLLQIHRSQKQIKYLMEAGWSLLSKLVSLAPALQKMSKDVAIPSVDELDPVKYLRYK